MNLNYLKQKRNCQKSVLHKKEDEFQGLIGYILVFHQNLKFCLLKEIFKSGELKEDSTIRKIRIVQREGNRDVSRDVDFYNLDAIIAQS